MKSSGLLKWLMLPVAALAIFAGIRLLSHDSKVSSADELQGRHLTPQESKDLGVGGDTPHDTVATLVGQVKLLRGEVKAAMEEGRQQRTKTIACAAGKAPSIPAFRKLCRASETDCAKSVIRTPAASNTLSLYFKTFSNGSMCSDRKELTRIFRPGWASRMGISATSRTPTSIGTSRWIDLARLVPQVPQPRAHPDRLVCVTRSDHPRSRPKCREAQRVVMNIRLTRQPDVHHYS